MPNTYYNFFLEHNLFLSKFCRIGLELQMGKGRGTSSIAVITVLVTKVTTNLTILTSHELKKAYNHFVSNPPLSHFSRFTKTDRSIHSSYSARVLRGMKGIRCIHYIVVHIIILSGTE